MPTGSNSTVALPRSCTSLATAVEVSLTATRVVASAILAENCTNPSSQALETFTRATEPTAMATAPVVSTIKAGPHPY